MHWIIVLLNKITIYNYFSHFIGGCNLAAAPCICVLISYTNSTTGENIEESQSQSDSDAFPWGGQIRSTCECLDSRLIPGSVLDKKWDINGSLFILKTAVKITQVWRKSHLESAKHHMNVQYQYYIVKELYNIYTISNITSQFNLLYSYRNPSLKAVKKN